jgi:hypothetical protein
MHFLIYTVLYLFIFFIYVKSIEVKSLFFLLYPQPIQCIVYSNFHANIMFIDYLQLILKTL